MAQTGFIGLGTIGGPMAARIAQSGQPLRVLDLEPAAVGRLVAVGASEAADITDLATSCETIFLSLPGPPQIEDVVLGSAGLLASTDGTLKTIVDLSTNSVSLNRQIAASASAKGIAYLDAPVSGGKIAAEKGSLAVMVGGDETAYNAAEHLIRCFGEHLFYMGASGAGTLTKLVNNQIFLCASVLIQEGFVMGAKAGMDPTDLLKVIKKSSAGTLMERAPLVLSRKFDMDLFSLAIAAKDVGVALKSAEDVGATMPMTAAAHEIYEEAMAQGLANEDFFATVKVLERAAGCELPPLRKPQR